MLHVRCLLIMSGQNMKKTIFEVPRVKICTSRGALAPCPPVDTESGSDTHKDSIATTSVLQLRDLGGRSNQSVLCPPPTPPPWAPQACRERWHKGAYAAFHLGKLKKCKFQRKNFGIS